MGKVFCESSKQTKEVFQEFEEKMINFWITILIVFVRLTIVHVFRMDSQTSQSIPQKIPAL